MGEMADYIIDKMIWGRDSGLSFRRPKTFQSGSGNFMWRTRDGRTLRMQDMDDDHIRNAISMCERNGNTGKALQLRQVLDGRKAIHKDDGYLPEYGGN